MKHTSDSSSDEEISDIDRDDEIDSTMKDAVDDEARVQVRFTTKLPKDLQVPETPFELTGTLTTHGLSDVINHLLKLDPPKSFDFLLEDGLFLRSSLKEYLDSIGEEVLNLEYIEAMSKPDITEDREHDDWVRCLDVGAENGMVVTGSDDQRIRIWDRTGECRLTFPAHAGYISKVAWITQDEKPQILSSSKDFSIQSWTANIKTGKAFKTKDFVGHQASVEALALAPSKKLFVSGCWEGKMMLWSLNDDISSEDSTSTEQGTTSKRRRKESAMEKKALGNLRGHPQAVSGLSWYHAHQIISASWDQSIKLWDVESGENTITMSAGTPVTAMAQTKDAIVYTGHFDARIRVWDSRVSSSKFLTKTLKGHNSKVSDLRWNTKNENLFASSSFDKTILVWDIRSEQPLHKIDAHDDKVLCVYWGEHAIYSGGADNKLKVHSYEQTS